MRLHATPFFHFFPSSSGASSSQDQTRSFAFCVYLQLDAQEDTAYFCKFVGVARASPALQPRRCRKVSGILHNSRYTATIGNPRTAQHFVTQSVMKDDERHVKPQLGLGAWAKWWRKVYVLHEWQRQRSFMQFSGTFVQFVEVGQELECVEAWTLKENSNSSRWC